MKIKEKIKLVTSLDDIFKIKIDKKFKKNKKCYIIPKYLNIIFYFYYMLGLPVFIVGVIFLFGPNFTDSLAIKLIESIVIYIICEYLIVLIIPIKKVPCGLLD